MASASIEAAPTRRRHRLMKRRSTSPCQRSPTAPRPWSSGSGTDGFGSRHIDGRMSSRTDALLTARPRSPVPVRVSARWPTALPSVATTCGRTSSSRRVGGRASGVRPVDHHPRGDADHPPPVAANAAPRRNFAERLLREGAVHVALCGSLTSRRRSATGARLSLGTSRWTPRRLSAPCTRRPASPRRGRTERDESMLRGAPRPRSNAFRGRRPPASATARQRCADHRRACGDARGFLDDLFQPCAGYARRGLRSVRTRAVNSAEAADEATSGDPRTYLYRFFSFPTGPRISHPSSARSCSDARYSSPSARAASANAWCSRRSSSTSHAAGVVTTAT